MNLELLRQKWINLLNKANANGLPIFTIRDPRTKMGSVSLTLVFISFNIWLVSVIGKTAGYLGGMNTDDCFNMFIACASLYFGRKFQVDGKKKDISDKVDSVGE